MRNFFLRIVELLRQNLIHSTLIKGFLYRIYWFRDKSKIKIALLRVARKKKNVFLVNIGANDGLTNDPLREFVITKKWRGLMVEPIPYVFERLKKVYKNRKGILLENAAISNVNGKTDFWYIEKTKELRSGEDQIGSFDKKVVLKSIGECNFSKKHLIKGGIKCLTLEKLLTKYKIKKIDVFSIDTEGFDYEIIKQINFKKFKPQLIIFEHCHLNLKDKEACFKLLNKNGYKIEDAEDRVNSIATRGF